MPQCRAPLVGQQVHRHRPALSLLAQGALERHDHAVEEDLRELRRAVHRLNGPDHDAGAVHVHEERGDAAVCRVGVAGPREQHTPVGVLGEARPHLLAGDAPAVLRAGRPTRQRGQVAPGPGLREALAPGLVAPQQPRHHGGGELRSRVVDHRGRQHLGQGVDAGFHQAPRGERLTQVGAQQARPAQPADALGPPPAHEPRLVGEALHLRQLGHLVVEGVRGRRVGPEVVLVLVEPVVERPPELVEVHQPEGVGRVGSWGRPESRAPLLRRNVMERVCSRQPSAVRR